MNNISIQFWFFLNILRFHLLKFIKFVQDTAEAMGCMHTFLHLMMLLVTWYDKLIHNVVKRETILR